MISFRNITHRFIIDDVACGIGHMDIIASNPDITGIHLYIKYDVLNDDIPIVPSCYYDVTFDNSGNVAGIEYIATHQHTPTIKFTAES